MNALLKIDSIMFFVSDLERAAGFYENVLGLRRVWTDGKRRMIGFVFPESDSEIVVHSDSSMPNPSFSFLVKNVQTFCDDYRRKGCTVVTDPFEVRCGKFAVLADLDGNELPIVDLTKFGDKPRYGE